MIAKTLKTVLVTDDTPHITHILRVSLQRAGCRVLIASNGKTALRFADSEHIDLLITDIEMPGITGFELLSQIRSKPGCAEVPVIFITGSGDPNMRAEADALGAEGFFTKPFSPVDLERRVMKILSL